MAPISVVISLSAHHYQPPQRRRSAGRPRAPAPTAGEEAVAARAAGRLAPERQVHVHALPVDVVQRGDAHELHDAALEVMLTHGHAQVAGGGHQPARARRPPVVDVVAGHLEAEGG